VPICKLQGTNAYGIYTRVLAASTLSARAQVKKGLPFKDFSLNKSYITYLRPMLPPGGRNWQIIDQMQQHTLKM
jgi:hypothetical protein